MTYMRVLDPPSANMRACDLRTKYNSLHLGNRQGINNHRVQRPWLTSHTSSKRGYVWHYESMNEASKHHKNYFLSYYVYEFHQEAFHIVDGFSSLNGLGQKGTF